MIDKGSDMGTIVNNKRLGKVKFLIIAKPFILNNALNEFQSGEISEPQIISNKDLVQISDSLFEFHIHSGREFIF